MQELIRKYFFTSASFIKKNAFFFVLAAWYAFFLCFRINAPFVGPHEDNNSFYGIAAANWLKYGPRELFFGTMTPFGLQGESLAQGEREFYLRHPQFSIAPLALTYRIFGVGEWQTRAVPAFFSLCSLVLFWFLIDAVFRSRVLTVASSLCYVLFPLGVYYGRMMVYEPFNRFFLLLALFLLITADKTRKGAYVFWLLLTVFVGGLMDWQPFFTAAVLWLYVLFKKDVFQRKTFLLGLPIAVCVSLAVTMAQIIFLQGAAGLTILYQIFLFRATAALPFFHWLILRSYNDVWGLTEIGFALAVLGTWQYFFRDRKNPLFGLALLLPGALYVAAFSNGAYYHQYWTLELTPFWALAAGWGLIFLWSRWKPVAAAIVVLFVAMSAGYTLLLFSRESIPAQDIALVKKLDYLMPADQEVCLTNTRIAPHVPFYIPRRFHYEPCKESTRYFVSVDWGLPMVGDNMKTGILDRSFWENAKSNIISVALVAELSKRLGGFGAPVKNFIQQAAMFSIGDAESMKTRNNLLIQEKNLETIECAATLCVYKIR